MTSESHQVQVDFDSTEAGRAVSQYYIYMHMAQRSSWLYEFASTLKIHKSPMYMRSNASKKILLEREVTWPPPKSSSALGVGRQEEIRQNTLKDHRVSTSKQERANSPRSTQIGCGRRRDDRKNCGPSNLHIPACAGPCPILTHMFLRSTTEKIFHSLRSFIWSWSFGEGSSVFVLYLRKVRKVWGSDWNSVGS